MKRLSWLMNLFILAMLLSVALASPPQPGETKHPTQTAHDIKQQTNNQQQGGNPSAAKPVVPASPKPADAEGTQKATQDKEQPVRITKPVAITTPADYATWVFSALLVIVGFLQAWILFGTLGVVRQQSKAADDSLALSRDTAQRQLRAYVCVFAANIAFKEPDRPDIEVHIKNCGSNTGLQRAFVDWIGCCEASP